MFDTHGSELSGERGTSTAFSGEGKRLTCIFSVIVTSSGIICKLQPNRYVIGMQFVCSVFCPLSTSVVMKIIGEKFKYVAECWICF